MQLANCTFAGNHILPNCSQGGHGGAVFFLNTLFHASVEDCAFIENSAAVAGGAVAADGTGLITVRHSTFIANTANRHGGALYLPG